MGPEIFSLRYLLAVAREVNMTRAAKILHVAQPSLPKQLSSLEGESGKKLLPRQSFRIRLTDEGILLRNPAVNLVRMADQIKQKLVSLDEHHR